MAKHKFQPHKIWNCDKTNDLTVNQPQKVIATKGCNQVQQTVSAERGVNVTLLDFINAAGGFLSPKKENSTLNSAAHSSHALQPLDISVFGPFKKAQDNGGEALLNIEMHFTGSHSCEQVTPLAQPNNELNTPLSQSETITPI
ncbi:hypothetical protein OUZ56_026518 [Daphnia magna]|uniref:Uncharacterized protein n=1 Tax=Daphnia magna TaxID=35525 RepID=A0ABQ9ZLZ4_9CRUS|nr:hypothetical protein OUZ56_026518 [Daphnia magna]